MNWQDVVSEVPQTEQKFALEYFPPLQIGERLIANIEEEDLLEAEQIW